MGSDPKYVGKGIVLILTAVILIFLLVYFLNAGPRKQSTSSSSQATTESTQSSHYERKFGTQIGSDLKGFLKDAEFFDIDMNNSTLLERDTAAAGELTDGQSSTGASVGGNTQTTVTTTSGENPSLSFFVQAGDGKMTFTFVDESSCVITGQRISIALSGKSQMYTADLTYIDENQDGVIKVEGLSPGVWEVRLNTLLGWQVPQDVFEVALDVEDLPANENDTSKEESEEDMDEEADDTAGTGDSVTDDTADSGSQDASEETSD